MPEQGHHDGDGCAIYDASCLVERDGIETFISELDAHDIFKENGQFWLVNDVFKVGPDDYHVDLESAGTLITPDQAARVNAAIKELWATSEEAGLTVLMNDDESDDGTPQVVITLEGRWPDGT